MTKPSAANTAPKQRGRSFQPGQSGNPAGKPKGARHRTTLAVEAIFQSDAEEVARTALAAAKGGDLQAIKAVLDRVAPAAKERSINIDLPPIASASDLPSAMAAVLTAVSAGELTPGEGQAVAAIVERWRAAFELSEIEQRLRALEGRSQ